MIRFVFVLVAVVAAVLAFLVNSFWLTALAGAAVAVAAALLIRDVQNARKEGPYAYEPRSRDEELKSLGIVEVRERKAEASGYTATSNQVTSGSDIAKAHDRAQAEGTEEADTSTRRGTPHPSTKPSVAEGGERTRNGTPEPLSSMLEGVRATLGAHTACLLSQEELALEYRVEAVAGSEHYLEAGGTFSTSAPLLTAGMSQQDVAFQSIGSEGLPSKHLGYYADEPPALRQAALAPLARAGHPTMWFLMVDAATDDFASSRAARTLLPRFADLLALMLDLRDAPDEQNAFRQPHATGAASDTEATPRPAPAGDGAASGEPRPRREIIAEEMERARAEGRNLALALVYLNRAETLATRGPEAVADAEAALRDRLEADLPQGRIERFGELTYGIFRHGPVDEIEAWAIGLEEEFADADPPLKGGISVGLAILQDSHPHAEAFRADATKALHEAYTTGTCTILA